MNSISTMIRTLKETLKVLAVPVIRQVKYKWQPKYS